MADVVDIPEFRAFYYTDDTPRQFYTLRRYEDESGSGEMHCYNIAPGIQLSFNDLNLSSCYQPLNVQKDFLEINYCLEGGHEVEMVGGGITFLGEKDLSISGLYHDKRVIVNSRIPFNKYKGITILLELETAQTTLDNEFSKWHIDLQKIRTTLCPEGRVLLIKSKQKIDHIFAEILSVENQIRLPYYWLKILETSSDRSIFCSKARRNNCFSRAIWQWKINSFKISSAFLGRRFRTHNTWRHRCQNC